MESLFLQSLFLQRQEQSWLVAAAFWELQPHEKGKE